MKNTMLINLLVNKTKENPTMGCREGGGKNCTAVFVLWLLFLYKATSFASINGFAWVLL